MQGPAEPSKEPVLGKDECNVERTCTHEPGMNESIGVLCLRAAEGESRRADSDVSLRHHRRVGEAEWCAHSK